MGTLRLQNMTFFGHHGELAAERALGGIFQVDVDMALDLSRAASSDDLSQTVDLAEIYGLVKEVVVGQEFHLLEALARAILEAIAGRYRPQHLSVRVRKPRPPLPGPVDFIEVELSLD